MSFTPDNSKASGINVPSKAYNDTTKGFVSLLSGSPKNLEPGVFEINPLAVTFVEDFIRRNGSRYEKMKGWGKPYFNLYDDILTKHGLPAELKYLSVIESDLRAGRVSCAGALGPWQIMPSAARTCGLKTGGTYDERNDFTKSTNAAAKLLKALYAEFGDWLLVIAAYNAGSGGVTRAIKKARSKNFWDIQYHLPAETRNHVKKFIAAHYYFEGSGGLTTITASEAKARNLALIATNDNIYTDENVAIYEVSGRYNSVVIANAILLDITLFNKLNPQFDNSLAQGNIYQLKLPGDKMEVFKAKKEEILKESVQLLLSSASNNSTGTKQVL